MDHKFIAIIHFVPPLSHLDLTTFLNKTSTHLCIFQNGYTVQDNMIVPAS